MKNKKVIILIISLILIIIPFFINVFSIYKLISIILGIILFAVYLFLRKKMSIFLVIYLPILLFIFTYALDYMKTYILKVSPIYVIENKVNENISIYNSIFYRVYKCQDEFIFDNEYAKNYVCDTHLIEAIDINKFLENESLTYKKYKHDFVKITGKVSKIIGNSKIELQEYSPSNELNGYVKFNPSSKVVINFFSDALAKYKIYDYITVVGILSEYDKKNNILFIDNPKIEENNLYENYELVVEEEKNCDLTLKEYPYNNYYTLCLNNIYLDYGISKYELSYALKDGKITFSKLVENAKSEVDNNNKLYEFAEFNILVCENGKNILMTKSINNPYSLCN